MSKRQGDVVERRLSLNGPAAVLIGQVFARELWRSNCILRTGKDVAAAGFPELSPEAPAFSGRTRQKSHIEAVSRREDGVAQ